MCVANATELENYGGDGILARRSATCHRPQLEKHTIFKDRLPGLRLPHYEGCEAQSTAIKSATIFSLRSLAACSTVALAALRGGLLVMAVPSKDGLQLVTGLGVIDDCRVSAAVAE